MKNFIILLLGFTLLILSQSCREDEIQDETEITIPDPDTGIVTSVSGIITDENNEPLNAVTLQLGTDMTSSDENGHFIFQEVIVNSNGSQISVEKSGFFDTYKFVFPELNTPSHLRIELITKEKVGEFVANQTGNITFGEASIDFEADAIIDSNGNPYQSTVIVYSHWYDPTDNDLVFSMPGDLRGADLDGNDVQLSTYGMMAVELETPGGEKLQIAEGKTATLSFPIPTEIAGDAPNEIPLWFFEESTGKWMEEGFAVKNGNAYVGEVAHFSFWNCDVPNDFIKLSGQVNLKSGPAVNYQLIVKNTSNLASATSSTNLSGRFCGWVPNDAELVLTIIGRCGDVIPVSYTHLTLPTICSV